MSSFFKKLLDWLKSLLGLTTAHHPPNTQPALEAPDSQQQPSPHGNAEKQTLPSLALEKTNKNTASFQARRILYTTFYELNRGNSWIGLAQLGSALKQKDPDFSPQKYNFERLSDLLEAAPDLVKFDRPNSKAQLNQPADVRALLTKAFKKTSPENDWSHLSSLKMELNKLNPQFSVQKYGFNKFKDFLENHLDLIQIKKNDSVYPVQYYARLSETGKDRPLVAPAKPKLPNSNHQPGPASQRPNIIPLYHYAFIPSQEETYRRLSNLALYEQWHFGVEAPHGFPYPILKSYLEYSFIRLQQEGKVFVSADRRYSTFNTGLVDRKYEPIYALFGWDQYKRNQDWYLIGFCVPGEGSEGKSLVANFDSLPETANYFDRPEDAFYDVHSGLPQVDWRHILRDNPDRLPLEFLQAYCPPGFSPKNVQTLSVSEIKNYKQQFSDALDADSQAYRAIVGQCEQALRFALLRTQLNYRIAVPYYNPRKNRLQLLLPLDLMGNETVNCALVVDRLSLSQRYIGHTILPLSWAYNNARLICRLENPWLTPQQSTDDSEALFDAESEDDDD